MTDKINHQSEPELAIDPITGKLVGEAPVRDKASQADAPRDLRINTDRVTHVDFGGDIREHDTPIVVEWKNEVARIYVLAWELWTSVAAIRHTSYGVAVHLEIDEHGPLEGMEIIFEAIQVAHDLAKKLDTMEAPDQS